MEARDHGLLSTFGRLFTTLPPTQATNTLSYYRFDSYSRRSCIIERRLQLGHNTLMRQHTRRVSKNKLTSDRYGLIWTPRVQSIAPRSVHTKLAKAVLTAETRIRHLSLLVRKLAARSHRVIISTREEANCESIRGTEKRVRVRRVPKEYSTVRRKY